MRKFHAKTQRTQRRKGTPGLTLREFLSAPLRLCVLCVFAQILFLSAVLAQTPDTERAQLRAYIETGRYAEAEASAKKSLLKTPDNGAVRHELAETLALTGRYTEAITEFERAATD